MRNQKLVNRLFAHTLIPFLALLLLLPGSLLAQSAAPNKFTMIIASDPQLPWACQYCGPGSETEQGQRSNEWQSKAMKEIRQAKSKSGTIGKWPTVPGLTKGAGSDITDPVGLILNGDLTAYWHGWQTDLYKQYYTNNFNLWLFPGLGNHDYQNNVNDCADSFWGWLQDGYMYCARQAVRYIKGMVNDQNYPTFNSYLMQSFDDGSAAYSFDIGAFHFVQLHNFPTYQAKDIPISSSLAWLERDLTAAAALKKKSVLTMHDYGDGMSPSDPGFLNAINNKNVIALFAGHIHEDFKYIGTIPATTIPYFRSGSSQYNKFFLVEFGDDYMNVGTISSANEKTIQYSVEFYGEDDPAHLKTYPHPTYVPTAGSGSVWSLKSRIRNEGNSGFAPSMASFNNSLYQAWRGNDGRIYYSTFNALTWSGQFKIPLSDQFTATDSPALAVFNGKLYCAWMHNAGDQTIHLASTADGNTWTEEKTLSGIGTQMAPALAAYGGKLYCAWNGYHNNGIFHASFDGTNWSGQNKIPGSDTSSTGNPPALATYNGKLYCAWMHYAEDQTIHLASTTDGGTWADEKTLSGIGTQMGPALATYEGKLFCAWNGYHNGGIFFASFDGMNWSGQRKADIMAENGKRCALTMFNERLYLGWENGGFWTGNYSEWNNQ